MSDYEISRANVERRAPEKIKTHFARIIVLGTVEEPYYAILYYDPKDNEYHEGYGSYYLECVFEWLSKYFEIVGGVFSNEPVVHGHWINQDSTYTRYQCSVCGARNYGGYESYCPNCGAKMYEETAHE